MLLGGPVENTNETWEARREQIEKTSARKGRHHRGKNKMAFSEFNQRESPSTAEPTPIAAKR